MSSPTWKVCLKRGRAHKVSISETIEINLMALRVLARPELILLVGAHRVSHYLSRLARFLTQTRIVNLRK
ncbi:MAG: hypothetical protein QNJ46_00510 [Leptolyngbyaceae cyanobacterium MO_188.B28]|nr:hypothetical protein [Leptolyngbyaceae cyanobacterium MO_188.B28]